jgi:uncharacterized protein YndB with AHSA1/START domain
MTTISYDVQTEATPERAYEAVSTEEGFQGWWTRTCSVDSRVGGEAEFRFYRGEAVMRFRIDALEPNRRVEMTCIDTENANPERQADQWLGTVLELQMEPLADGGTEVRLRHSGWPQDSPVLPQIEQGWKHFTGSLERYLETGTGTPYADPA